MKPHFSQIFAVNKSDAFLGLFCKIQTETLSNTILLLILAFLGHHFVSIVISAGRAISEDDLDVL